jgi:hypothetical protein
MRSNGTENCVPEVPRAQWTLDRTRKHLRKLRWIGKESEARTIMEAVDDPRLRPSLSRDRRERNCRDWTALQETTPACAD